MISDALSGRELWRLDVADCFDALPLIPDGAVAHVVTDPPYEREAHTKARRVRAAMDGRSARPDSRGRTAGVGEYAIGFDALDESSRAAAGSHFARLARRWMLIFCQVEAAMLWRGAVGEDRYVRTMVWDKPDATPQLTGDRPAQGYESIVVAHREGEKKRWNAGGKRGVYRAYVNPKTRTHEHMTEKPLELMLDLIADFTDPGDLVLDPFAGSGTTGVACLRLGRRFIGIEKDPKFARLARERLEAESKGSTLQAQRSGQEVLFR